MIDRYRERVRTDLVLLDELPRGEFTLSLARAVDVRALGRIVVRERFGNLDRLVVVDVATDAQALLARRVGRRDGHDRRSQDKALDRRRLVRGAEGDEGRLDRVVHDFVVLWRERHVRRDVSDPSDVCGGVSSQRQPF